MYLFFRNGIGDDSAVNASAMYCKGKKRIRHSPKKKSVHIIKEEKINLKKRIKEKSRAIRTALFVNSLVYLLLLLYLRERIFFHVRKRIHNELILLYIFYSFHLSLLVPSSSLFSCF